MLIADTNEYHPLVDAAAYGAWSQAVILRAHNGWREDHAYAAERGLLAGTPQIRVVGHYGYVVSSDDAGQQGRDFAHVVLNRGGLPHGHFICADLEEGAGDQTPRLEAWLAGAHEVLNDPAADEMAYSGANYWTLHLGTTPQGIHRWIAAYGPTRPNLGEVLWQYTDRGPVPGVQGPCDCSTFTGTVDQLLALIGAPTAPPKPAPLPPPLPPYQVGDRMLHTVTVATDQSGNGWTQTTIGWSTFQAATMQGPNPPTDGYWPGTCKVQDRNNQVLVVVEGCPPGSVATVFILASA